MLGYALALLIGVSLGLLGGGGSILTVPILVYAMGMDAKLSIALSLAIVGATSLIGVVGHFKKGNVNLKVALIFGPIAMIGTYLGARLSVFFSGQAQLIFFAIIMLVASVFMFRDQKSSQRNQPQRINYTLIAIEGIVVGIVTGLVGVGGGFLIVPALVLLTPINMKQAVGTSLLIIAMKSFAGFAGYATMIEIPWVFLAAFVGFSAVGIFLGTFLIVFISQDKLKKSFAIFLMVMGLFILYQNRDTLMGKEPASQALEMTSKMLFKAS